MKKTILLFVLATLFSNPTLAAPSIEGAWVTLQKAPNFLSPSQNLAPTWGPTVPMGAGFQIEKAYGRWLYGVPSPLPYMLKKHYAPAGWIYSRMLLPSGDSSVLSPAVRKEIFLTSYYANETWKKLGLPATEESLVYFRFLESLVLSKKTMQIFRAQDEEKLSHFSLVPVAYAENESLGIIGANLDFLQQEFRSVEIKKKKENTKKLAKTLLAPKIPKASNQVLTNIMGRYLAYRSLKLPTLSHEEVDASLYLQAVAKRVLDSCPAETQKIWSNKHWHIFRFLQLRSDQMPQNSWLQFELPGSYFAISSKAIDIASNEAELSFLIARPFLKNQRVKTANWKWTAKTWPEDLKNQAADTWSKIQKNQSTRLSENLDVADEIAIDLQTFACMAKAGYSPEAGIQYLKKLLAAKDQSWAKWYHDNNIGLQYRTEQAEKLLRKELATAQIPPARTINKKRFMQATELWNRNP